MWKEIDVTRSNITYRQYLHKYLQLLFLVILLTVAINLKSGGDLLILTFIVILVYDIIFRPEPFDYILMVLLGFLFLVAIIALSLTEFAPLIPASFKYLHAGYGYFKIPFIRMGTLFWTFLNTWSLQQWVLSIVGLVAFYIVVYTLINRSRWANVMGKLTRNNIIFLMLSDFAINLVIGMICMYPTLRNTWFGSFMSQCPIAISPIIFVIEISAVYWASKHFLNKGYSRGEELYLTLWHSPHESLFILVTFALLDKNYGKIEPNKKKIMDKAQLNNSTSNQKQKINQPQESNSVSYTLHISKDLNIAIAKKIEAYAALALAAEEASVSSQTVSRLWKEYYANKDKEDAEIERLKQLDLSINKEKTVK